MTTWNVSRLRASLQEVKIEASEPESKTNNADEARCDDLHVLIAGFRPLLENLDKLVTEDQRLKGKRIWRRDKDKVAAVDHIDRQLELRIRKVDSYLSVLRNNQLARVLEKTGKIMEVFDRRHEPLGRSSPMHGEAEFDVQWSLLKHELVEDGMTIVDIEAHKSSIKALLQDRLPSYHEAHAGFIQAESSEVSLGSAMSRTSERGHSMFTNGESGSQRLDTNKHDLRSIFQPDVDVPDSRRNDSKGETFLSTLLRLRTDCK